jgi:FSR family fosmidomycin resistance protein-like MFS transporter
MSRLNRIGIGSGGTPHAILFFACAAHFLHHVLLSLYLTLVLTLTGEWRMSYGDLIALWTVGSLLVGLGAPLAGWLGDKWGESRTMVLVFLGLGFASVLCGLAQSPATMTAALAVLGAFGALYHPVGNSWVVKHAAERGKAIAFAGIAGSFGVAAGPVVAGVLNDAIDWRWAFILPGIVTIAFGVALIVLMRLKLIPERDGDAHAHDVEASSARERRNVIMLLALTMTLTLIATTAFVTALPKLVEDAVIVSKEGLIGVGLLTGAIYLAASGAQFVGGHYADRGAARRTYMLSFVMLAAVFVAAALANGWVILGLAVAVMFLFEAIAPIETVFVARFAPANRRGLFFGLRYAIAVVGGPVGVWLVAALYDPTLHFDGLLYVLAAATLATAALSLALPQDRAAVLAGGAK